MSLCCAMKEVLHYDPLPDMKAAQTLQEYLYAESFEPEGYLVERSRRHCAGSTYTRLKMGPIEKTGNVPSLLGN